MVEHRRYRRPAMLDMEEAEAEVEGFDGFEGDELPPDGSPKHEATS